MPLPILFNRLNELHHEAQVGELLDLNKESETFGLSLTPSEAGDILILKQTLLKGYGRVEIDIEATRKIIYMIIRSPYLSQDEYSSTLCELHELFYYIKNRTNDQIGDDELIGLLGGFYENCRGCVELMNGKELDDFVRNLTLGQKREE